MSNTISEVLDRFDITKTDDNPDGNPFTPRNLSKAEALASIKQIIEEQVIGENRLIVGNDIQQQLASFGNQLRKEQRQSLNAVLGK